MAGRVPAIHALLTGHADDRRMGGWVDIMSNKRNGTLYIGVTNDLIRRVWEHREGTGSSFVRWYSLTRLVYFEHHDDIRTAIQREGVEGSSVGGTDSGLARLVHSAARLNGKQTWMAGTDPRDKPGDMRPAMTV